MTLLEIIAIGLKAAGFEGLMNNGYADEGGCSCKLDDLSPCGDTNLDDCEPCYFRPCAELKTDDDCMGCETKDIDDLCATTIKKEAAR